VQSKSANLALLGLVLCVGIALHSATASAFTLTNPNSWPLIPIPEIVTDPYAGTMVGLMPVFLQLNSSQQIRRIIAPDVNYNTILVLTCINSRNTLYNRNVQESRAFGAGGGGPWGA